MSRLGIHVVGPAHVVDRLTVRQDLDGYLDLAELARYSSLSVRTLRALVRDGLPHYRTRGRAGKILVRRSDFDRWMSARRQVRSRPAEDVGQVLDAALAAVAGGTGRGRRGPR